MRLRHVTFSLLLALILLAFAQTTFAQALDISSGGLPTITGAVGGSVFSQPEVSAARRSSITNNLPIAVILSAAKDLMRDRRDG